jgi:lipopolysaccharide/colanic/teichoic acid biosynthesis glycosyltransferase
MRAAGEFRLGRGTHPCVFSGYARDGEEVGCAYPRLVSMASHTAHELTRTAPRTGARSHHVTTLAEQYARLARETPRRPGVDLELRTLDVVFSAVFLLLSLPFALVIGLAILVTSGRPVFYRGRRVGRGGRIFTMTKFRTLQPGAEERIGQHLGSSLVAHTDAEVTRIGRRLRATQLDEIPQLWHVLKGDMSLVGPRPIRPRFFEELATELPAYWQRLVVRPGLTGFAQVRRGYETPMAEKLAHDLEWIADRSVHLYLRTLTATAWRVLGQSLRGLFRPAT